MSREKKITEKKDIQEPSWWRRFLEDIIGRIQMVQLPAIAAQSAYYLILSIFPFLIVLVTLLQKTPLMQPETLLSLMEFFPQAVKDLVFPLLDELSTNASTAPLAALAGIWTASAGLYPIIRVLDRAAETSKNRNLVSNRAIAIIFTVGLILMIFIVIITQLIGPSIVGEFLSFLGLDVTSKIWQTFVLQIATLAYMFFYFLLLFRYATTNRKEEPLSFQELLPGTVVTTLGIVIATWGFRFYVNNFARYTVVYGSIAGIMILCIWFYLISFVMMLGGTINVSLLAVNNGRYCLDEEYQVTIPIEKIKNLMGKKDA